MEKNYIIFASEEAAREEARKTGGRVEPFKILEIDGRPHLDAGEPVIVYQVIY